MVGHTNSMGGIMWTRSSVHMVSRRLAAANAAALWPSKHADDQMKCTLCG